MPGSLPKEIRLNGSDAHCGLFACPGHRPRLLGDLGFPSTNRRWALAIIAPSYSIDAKIDFYSVSLSKEWAYRANCKWF